MKRAIIVTCSGASNTGTTADTVARGLCVDQPEVLDLLCLSAFAIRKAPSIKKLEGADRIVVLEGCASRCASEILRQGSFSPDLVLEMASDYKIQKNMVPKAEAEGLEKIIDDVKMKMKGM